MKKKYDFQRLTKKKNINETIISNHKREMKKFSLKKNPLLKQFEKKFLDLPPHIKKQQKVFNYEKKRNYKDYVQNSSSDYTPVSINSHHSFKSNLKEFHKQEKINKLKKVAF